jgi:hypothetical protein
MAIAGTTTMAVEIAQAVATARLLHQFLLGQGLNESVYPQKLSGVLWITSLINMYVWFPTSNACASRLTSSNYEVCNRLLFREFSPFIVDGCTRFDAQSQLYRCYVIWGCEKKVTIFPTLLILSTFGAFPSQLFYTLANVILYVFIFAAVGNVAIYNPEAVLITYGLSAATNVILTSLTGTVLSYIASLQSVIIFAKLVGYCGSGVMHRESVPMKNSAVAMKLP